MKTIAAIGVFAACFGTTALAQDTQTKPAEEVTTQTETAAPEAPAPTVNSSANLPLSTAEEVKTEPALGSTYVKEEHGDWEVHCILTEDGKDPCQLYQLLENDDGVAVAEFTIFKLPDGQKAEAGAVIVTPLETLLTEQLSLTVDGTNARRYPFSWCSQIGCFARIGLTGAEVTGMKRGAAAEVMIVPVAAPDKKVALSLSLTGFTAGYDAVAAMNAANLAD